MNTNPTFSMQDLTTLKPGTRLGRCTFGPFTSELVLKMASLTRDFHPSKVRPLPTHDAGLTGALLHTPWVSGMIETCVRELVKEARAMKLSVTYHGAAYRTDALVLHTVLQSTDARRGVALLTCRVTRVDGSSVAEGTVQLHVIS